MFKCTRKKIWKKCFRQKNKLLLFLLLTVIQCKQRCTRTSLPCNVTVVDLKYFFRFPKLLNSLLCRIRYWYSLFFPGRRVRAHLQNPATKCDFPIGYFIFLLTLEKCAILQCSVLSIRSKLPFLFHRVLVFLSCFVLCPFIY
jgi:hypothetical protein